MYALLKIFPHKKVIDTLLAFSDLESLHQIMFYLVCLVPMVVAVLQILSWRFFSILNSHTVNTKYIDG